MKAAGHTKKKSSSGSRSKNYYGITGSIKKSENLGQAVGVTKYKKDVLDLQNNAMANYPGGKFLRGRKYSFPFHQKEKRKNSESNKVAPQGQMKKINPNNSKQLMMLNVSGDHLNTGYEDLLGYSTNNRMGISKPSTSNSRQNVIKYSTNSKKKKSNSAQSSPHRNGLKTSKNQNYPVQLGVGLSSGQVNETRPYSAKNSGYARQKPYSAKGKKGEMKRSSSKKSPTSVSKDFGPAFYNKYAHPSGIGLYEPGKVKLGNEKQSVSSRGTARWNKSPQHQKIIKTAKGKNVSLYRIF